MPFDLLYSCYHITKELIFKSGILSFWHFEIWGIFKICLLGFLHFEILQFEFCLFKDLISLKVDILKLLTL